MPGFFFPGESLGSSFEIFYKIILAFLDLKRMREMETSWGTIGAVIVRGTLVLRTWGNVCALVVEEEGNIGMDG